MSSKQRMIRYHFSVILMLMLTACNITEQETAHGSGATNARLTGNDAMKPPHVMQQRTTAQDPHRQLSPQQLTTVALQHMEEGRAEEAILQLSRALQQYPGNTELLSVRGSILLQLNQFSAALDDLTLSLEFNPDDPQTLTNRAEALRQFGRIKEALADLDLAIALAPDLLAAHFNRGNIYYSSNDYEKALQDFNRCIEMEPMAAAPYFNRASSLDALGNREAAISDLLRFRELTENPQWQATADKLMQAWHQITPESQSTTTTGSSNS